MTDPVADVYQLKMSINKAPGFVNWDREPRAAKAAFAITKSLKITHNLEGLRGNYICHTPTTKREDLKLPNV